MECGYSLEPSPRGSSNEYHNVCLTKRGKMMYTPAKPQFYYIKVGFKGVKIVQACFRVEIMMMMVWYFFFNINSY